jgi:hypothetical protein
MVRGRVWIRGLGTLEERTLRGLFLQFGRAIGSVDTTYGELYDVTDSGGSYRERAIPVSQTRAATAIHTDSSRLETHPRWVGLACVRQAPEGGGSLAGLRRRGPRPPGGPSPAAAGAAPPIGP